MFKSPYSWLKYLPDVSEGAAFPVSFLSFFSYSTQLVLVAIPAKVFQTSSGLA